MPVSSRRLVLVWQKVQKLTLHKKTFQIKFFWKICCLNFACFSNMKLCKALLIKNPPIERETMESYQFPLLLQKIIFLTLSCYHDSLNFLNFDVSFYIALFAIKILHAFYKTLHFYSLIVSRIIKFRHVLIEFHRRLQNVTTFWNF